MKIRSESMFFMLATAILLTALPAIRAGAATESEGTFVVSGDVRTGGTWSVERVRHDLKADIRTIHYVVKGQSYTADAVPLLALIDAVRPAVNHNIKHHELQFIIAVRGFDGYTVDFSMAELLPEFGNRHVWVALDEDGKPLVEDGGALQIIAPDDVKPARWVHGIIAITIVDTAKLSTGG